jgi:drug/metabolite transporter (DMT)-like permease
MSASQLLAVPRVRLSDASVHRLLFVFVCLVWGTNWLAMKVGVSVVPPALFSGLRWTTAGSVLLLWRWSRGWPVRVNLRLLPRLVLVSLLLVTFNAIVMLYGLRHVGSGLAGVVNSALTPIALLGFSVLLGFERFALRQLGAIGLGVAGIAILFGPAVMAGTLDRMTLLGTAGITIACLSYSLGSVLAMPLMRSMAPTEMAAMTNFIGGSALLTLSLLFEPGSWHALSFDWGIAAWSAWLFLLLLGSLGATIVYFLLVRDWGASRTGTYAFVSPVVAVVLGVVVLGEQVHLNDAIGMVMMLAAAGLALRRT